MIEDHYDMELDHSRRMAAWVMAAGAAAIVVGTFLPWRTLTAVFVGQVSRNGIDGGGDGIATLCIGTLLGFMALTVLNGRPGRQWLGGVLLGGFALSIALIDIAGTDAISDDGITVGVGGGLYLVALGGILALGAGFGLRRAMKEASAIRDARASTTA